MHLTTRLTTHLAVPAALLVLSLPAHAADVIVDVPAPPPPVVEPVFSWSGFYGGVHAGYAFSGNDADTLFDPFAVQNPDQFEDNFSDDGFFAGGQVGAFFEVGGLILGVDADASYIFDNDDTSNLNGVDLQAFLPGRGLTQNGRIEADTSLEFIGHVRGQVGFAVDRFMVYAAGGLAFSDADYEGRIFDLNDTNNGVPELIGTIEADGADVGYTIGGGANFAFSDNAFVNLDYRYSDLGTQDITYAFNGNANNGPFTEVAERDLDFHTVRVGLNFKFN